MFFSLQIVFFSWYKDTNITINRDKNIQVECKKAKYVWKPS